MRRGPLARSSEAASTSLLFLGLGLVVDVKVTDAGSGVLVEVP
jgi:hypothetical protein